MTEDSDGPDAGEERGGLDDGEDRGTPTTDAAADGPECPFCGSTETERESAFGSEVSAQQFYCHGCHTVFERIKFDGASADAGRTDDADRRPE